MKKMKRRSLGILLSLMTVLGLMSGMCLTAYADDTTGTPITADTTTLSDGTYYLSSDVALNSEMQVSGTVVINLNGHTLSLKSDAEAWQSVIYADNADLTVNGNGGKISGGTGGHNQRGGGFRLEHGAVTVNDVDIIDNKAAWGGGVYIGDGAGTFTMNNSNIRNNRSIDDSNGWNDAGGVYMDAGTLTINGGSIQDNYVDGGKKNGVVYTDKGKVNISGDVIIYNNKDGEQQENLFANAIFGGSSSLAITGPLGPDAKIGITSGWHQVFTNSPDTDNNDPAKFVSDNSDYRVGRNADGQLMLAWYNEIINSAKGYEGTYDGQEHGIKVIASDPTTAVVRYGTSADNCTLEKSPVYTNAGENVVYYKVTAPVGGGGINFDTVTGSATVKINKADPTYTVPSDLSATYGDTLSTVKLPDGWTWEDDSVDVGDAGTSTFKATFTPTDTENYNIVENIDVTVTVAKKAAPTLTDGQKPKVNTGLTFINQLQELVVAPGEKAPDGYTLMYALGTDANTPPDSAEYEANIPTGTEAGTYYVWYKAVGDANHGDGEPTCLEATVAKAGISKAEVELSQTSYAYDGKAKEPAVKSVVLNGKTLTANTDYTLSYKDNVNVGTATATITGKGNYTGTKSVTFKIEVPSPSPSPVDAKSVTIDAIDTQTYTGKAVTPKPNVTHEGKTLREGTDYTLSYKDNTACGTGSVTITFKGGYTGTRTVEFQIADVAEMHRLYNPNSGEHFYTANTQERDTLVEAGWEYEGIGWYAPKSGVAVHRLYSGTDHHYTTNEQERDTLVAVGWKYEGVCWYSDLAEGVALWRQYNPNVQPSAPTNNSGSHNYTTSKQENDELVAIGWIGEGISWYGVKVA